MTNLNSNVAHARGTLSRSSSSSSLSSHEGSSPVKKRQKTDSTEIEIPKSIFDNETPESHKAVVLTDQEFFKKFQNTIIKHLNNFFSDSFTSKEIKNDLMQKLKYHYPSTMMSSINARNLIQGKVCEVYKNACDIADLQPISSLKPLLQFGTTISNILHKDNGILESDNETYLFDYTVVIPILDYDLTGHGKHNFTPISPIILPMEYKSLVPNYNLKQEKRQAVGYRQIPDTIKKEIEKHFISERLTQGTAVILHAATTSDDDDDGESVIHKSPETPVGFTRIFIIGRANKK